MTAFLSVNDPAAAPRYQIVAPARKTPPVTSESESALSGAIVSMRTVCEPTALVLPSASEAAKRTVVVTFSDSGAVYVSAVPEVVGSLPSVV